VTIYTIGWSTQITSLTKGDPDAGEQLLSYIAQDAGGVSANHGEYHFAPTLGDLVGVFQDIADNIFTRLTQ
jgi:hypothetical protein